MSPLHRGVAANIRRIAKAKGIPISHVADRAGVSRSMLWAVLRGTSSPTLAWLERVAAVLEVEVIDLFTCEVPRGST